ncbi:MAG: DUF3536 domain-containing protein [Nitrospiraceae bacterium]|nr:DUF3536 domain-containing protein [Nitrospiraceae bacterium]
MTDKSTIEFFYSLAEISKGKKRGYSRLDNQYIVIHAHMYQPPRENAWLEAIEVQDSPRPYHDWNERITTECYAANAYARILDDQHKIINIGNNYGGISFNFGPTLLSWLEEFSKPAYEKIIEADRQSIKEHSGHGNAISQCYNHIIMPLASRRDKITQVIWGIEDFRHRFSRDPEGMWLPETAVNTETLEVLASQGIKFTILAPGQALMVKAPGQEQWTPVDENSINTRMPYIVKLPLGRSITVFFYNGPASRGVAFEGLLRNGVRLADRLTQIFTGGDQPELALIATDGESYGHHSQFGDMALAYCLDYIKKNNLANLVNYGEYLEKNPPTWEARIKENTSWSCFHGVERWRSDCGCSIGAHHGWNQQWRTPLRDALDWLSGRLAEDFEELAKPLFKDPWQARDGYIGVVLDRSEAKVADFLDRHAPKKSGPKQRIDAIKLLEMQRQAMLMFTSCGWFFDDISGIETLQVLQYACRALQLRRELKGDDLEGQFLRILSRAKSNVKEAGGGAELYERQVKVKMIDLGKVAVHYAISSLFEDYAGEQGLYCYDVKKIDYKVLDSDSARMAVGKINVRSRITGDDGTWQFAVLKKSGHEITCGLVENGTDQEYEEFKKTVKEFFSNDGVSPEEFKKIDKFNSGVYSIKDLFLDEQRKVLEAAVKETLEDSMRLYAEIYERDRFLMDLLRDFKAPIPKPFLTAAELALVPEIEKAVRENPVNIQKAEDLCQVLAGWGLEPTREIETVLKERVKGLFAALGKEKKIEYIKELRSLVKFASTLPFQINLWDEQNLYYELAHTIYREMKAAGKGEEWQQWDEEFRALGEDLYFNTGEALRGPV